MGLYKDSNTAGGQVANCDEDDIICRYNSGDTFTNCDDVNWEEEKACVYYRSSFGYYGYDGGYYIQNEDGDDIVVYAMRKDNQGNEYKGIEIFKEPNGNIVKVYNPMPNGTLYQSNENFEPYDGLSGSYQFQWHYTPDGTVYKSFEEIRSDDGTILNSKQWYHTADGTVYLLSEGYENDNDGTGCYIGYDESNNVRYRHPEGCSIP